ncbi:hypothetical protein PsYK624_134130 [Phanerochaete sordida]|uniref:Uncharacterized protein n=1 Tax=Phanerochaete sordida TaxID=48140 RepID=A0A9P3GPJ0_9APHY|nr:hypothetical protein PsYK624_134130 [Phanerochaete sordida]
MFSRILQDNPFLHPVVHDVTAGQSRDNVPRLQLVSIQLAGLAPKLERLCLRDGSFYAMPAFRVMVRQHRSLASLFVKNVSFHSVGDVVQLLSSLTQLKHFRMSNISWVAPSTTRPCISSRKTLVRISSLYVGADGGWIADARTSALFSWFVRSGFTEALTAADLSGMPISTSRNLEDVEAVIRCSARSLVFTALKFSADACPSMLSNALSTISQLRTFYLFVPDHLPSLVDTVQFFSGLSCSSLRDIRICLEKLPPHTTSGRPAALRKLDRVLQLPQYSSLRRVTLDHRRGDILAEYFMDDFCHPVQSEERRRTETTQLFSLTHKRGILWYWPVMSRGPVHIPQ